MGKTHEEQAKLRFEEANNSAKILISQHQNKKRLPSNKVATKHSNSTATNNKRSNVLLDQGVEEANKGRIYKAIELHAQAIGENPKNLKAKRNLSILLKRIGNLREAEEFIRECINNSTHDSNNWNTLGTILADQAKLKEAGEAYKRSLTIDPNNSSANSNLAGIYHAFGLIDPAFTYSSKAISLNSGSKELWLEHLTQLRRVCQFEDYEKINWWKVAMKVEFNSLGASFLQLLAGSATDEDQAQLRRLQKHWAEQAEQRVIQQSNTKNINYTDKNKVNIGLVSSDFKDHSVARFIWPLFKYLDRSKYSIYCYSIEKKDDEWQRKFIKHATEFRNIALLSEKELIEQIKDDKIDVLFDLTGFTQGSRTRLFANRIAPNQVSWLGYPGSTGLKNMDFIFADKYLAPSQEDLISEKIMITEGSSVCFSEIKEVPITRSLPESVRGYITFGTLNNPYKFTSEMIENWASIMHELDSSRFLFVRREFASYYLRENVAKAFEKKGINNERICFFNNRAVGRHYLDCYNEIDITLDTYPVTGGTTTVDALWMGVPVITKRGKNIHQRVSSAILHHAGRSDWICKSNEEYITKAIELAKDQPQRQQCRLNLREEIKRSDLCDEKKFSANFSASINKTMQR